MQYIKYYLDYALIGLVLVGEGFAYGATSSSGRLLYFFHLILLIPLLGRYVLYLLEEAERRKISEPEERVRSRANFDLVVKSKTINDESQKRLSHYSALFLHLKNLATMRDEAEQINLFLNILQKSLHCAKVSFFNLTKNGSSLVLRQSTDIKFSNGKHLEILLSEDSLLGYAAVNREGLYADNLTQNIKIAHLSTQEPIKMKLCMPIMFNEELIGLVNVGEIKKKELSREEKNFLSTICTLLGLSINNARNFRLVENDLADSERLVLQKNRTNERIKSIFSKFTSPNVVKALVETQQEVVLGGESKQISLMFCDIRSFTAYCEERSPAEVVEILNEYLTRMSQIIIRYHGTLDKYMGDEIMSFWGAPLEQPNHAKLAVQSGFEMLIELKKLRVKWEKEGKKPFGVGIGINTGEVIVGNIGSAIRMDYTVIGDPVNLAARVEALTRKFNSDFLITEATYQLVKDIVQARKIGALQVKGKQEPAMIYSVERVDLKPLD